MNFAWLIANWEWILTIILIIVIGIPFLIVMIIPTLVYFLGKKGISLEFLIKYFNVDVTKEPYSKWMEKHPFIFVGLTSIELYTSYFTILIIKSIKNRLKKIKGEKNEAHT
jgi:hypothetical protein